MTFSAGGHADDLWAITAYFNPIGYRRRRTNYRVFRQYLNVPLVAVELAYGPDFELQAGDAEILVQLRGHDVLWQRERLLNLALKALPDACRKVVWIDCDIVFAADDWAERLSHLLDRFLVVQALGHIHHLGADGQPGKAGSVELTQPSVSFAIANGMPAAVALDAQIDIDLGTSAVKGYAWAARREVFDRHGFYDVCIVGGADRAMACAYYGHFDTAMRVHCMNEWQREHYLQWARACFATVRSNATFLDCDIYHLWHGELRHRYRLGRHRGLICFDFNPIADIVIADQGAWRWNSGKSEMHNYVRAFFVARQEDGASE